MQRYKKKLIYPNKILRILTKKCNLIRLHFCYGWNLFAKLLKLCNMLHQWRLDICCFILVNNIVLSKFVKHFLDCWIKFHCFILVCHCTEFANCITHCFSVIMVVGCSDFCLTYALLTRFVVCHFFFRFVMSLGRRINVSYGSYVTTTALASLSDSSSP